MNRKNLSQALRRTTLLCLVSYSTAMTGAVATQLKKAQQKLQAQSANVQKASPVAGLENTIAQLKKPFSIGAAPQSDEDDVQQADSDWGMISVPVFARNGNSTRKRANYKGQIRDGKPNGFGVVIEPDGKKIEGWFDENGNLRDFGKITYPDGQISEGQFRKGMLHGICRVMFPDGETYEGQFENGKPRGICKVISSDGTTREGQFENETINGFGKLTYPDGTTNEGQFSNNTLHGYGAVKHTNGYIFAGQYENGRYMTQYRGR